MSVDLRAAASAASLGGLMTLCACFNPENSSTDSAGSAAGTGDPTDGETLTAGPGDSNTAGVTCSSENTFDPACPASTPYCSSGTCVDCTGVTCSEVFGGTPVCDAESGRCVECTDVVVDACEATQSACIDNVCTGCTDDAQCPSGVCQTESGECLLQDVTVSGIVYDWGSIDRVPVGGVTVQITNLEDAPTASPTDADGLYSLPGLAVGNSLNLQPLFEQNNPVIVPAALTSRTSIQVTNDPVVKVDIPLIRYEWMAQVAFECGIFETLDEAIGGTAVNPYFIERSTVFGQLVDGSGNGVATLSKAALRAKLGDWPNFDDNITDEDPDPTEVCFLDEDVASGTYVGTTLDASTATGRFAIFRVRNEDGLGQGQLSVTASGFDDAFTTLSSSGNIGVTPLLRNNDVIPRDFAIDVYPLFEDYGCVSCHYPGGPGHIEHESGDGHYADWTLPADEVWERLVGPGTDCSNNPSSPLRICVDDPERSLFITRPLADPAGTDDGHPTDIFTSLDTPTVQIMLDWIQQGAAPPARISFVNDIYPLFSQYSCTDECHRDGGPQSAINAGYPADWSVAPQQAWENLTGPGDTCSDSEEPLRVCIDDPLSSKLVTYPLSDDANQADNHPADAFASPDHPALQLIIQWIAQGATFDSDCGAFDPCTVGGELPLQDCSQCVTDVCGVDPQCCSSGWDSYCVERAQDATNCGC